MKRYLWLFILITVLGVAAFFFFRSIAQDADPEVIEESVKTSKVRKGDIIISASGV